MTFPSASSQDFQRSLSRRSGFVRSGLQAALMLSWLGCTQVQETGETQAETPQPLAFQRSVLDGFEAEILDALERYRVPGAAVVVIYRDHEVFSGGFGYRHIGRAQPMDSESLFRIGGVSTLLSSTMLATLVDEKRLDWHDTLGATVPEQVTALLAAAPAGLETDVLSLESSPSRVPASKPESPEQGVDGKVRAFTAGELGLLLGQAATVADPYGEPAGLVAAAYEDQTHDLYTAIVHGALENAGADSDDGFQRLMHERLFGPAGMARTAVANRLPTLAEDFATPYGLGLDGSWVEADYPAPLSGAPSAGIVSTAGDLARFLIVHLHDGIAQSGKRVASARNLEASRRAHFSLESWASEFGETPWPLAEKCCWGGAGWQTVFLPEETLWLGGEGGIEGFVTELGLLPREELALVVLANLDARVGGRHFVREVRDAFLARVLGSAGTVSHSLDYDRWLDRLAKIEQGARPVTLSKVRSWLGHYEQGWQVRFSAGELRLQKELEVLPVRSFEDELVVAEGPRLGSGVRFERLEGRAALVFASQSGKALHRVWKLE